VREPEWASTQAGQSETLTVGETGKGSVQIAEESAQSRGVEREGRNGALAMDTQDRGWEQWRALGKGKGFCRGEKAS
jgi:hypothetical protein